MDLFELEIDYTPQVDGQESRNGDKDLASSLLSDLRSERTFETHGSSNEEDPTKESAEAIYLESIGSERLASRGNSGANLSERELSSSTHAVDTFIPESGASAQQPFIVTGGRDNRVHVFAMDQEMTPLYSLGDDIGNGHSDMITCLKTYQSPDDGPTLIISGSRDRSIRVWIVMKKSCYKVLKGHQDTVWCLDVVSMPDTEPLIVSGGIDGFVIVWSLLRGERLREIFLGADRAIFCLRIYKFQGAPMVLFGGEDEIVSLWSIESGEIIRTYRGHSDTVHCVDVLYNYAGDPHSDHSVHSQMDDLMVSGGRDKQVIVWSLTTGVQLRTLQWHSGAVFSLVFKPLMTGRRNHKDLDTPCDSMNRHLYDLHTESKIDYAPEETAPRVEETFQGLQTRRETKDNREARQLSEGKSFRALYGDVGSERRAGEAGEAGAAGADDFIPSSSSSTVNMKKKGEMGFLDWCKPFLSRKKVLDYRRQDNNTIYVVDAIIVSSDKLGTTNVSSLNTGALLMSSTHHHGPVLSTAVVSTSHKYSTQYAAAENRDTDASDGYSETPSSMQSEVLDNWGSHNHSRGNDDILTRETAAFQHSMVDNVVYTVGVEKKIVAERWHSHYSAAVKAYVMDKNGTLPPVKVLNTVPEKYREWSNVYLTALKHAPSIDAFFARETFMLFHQAILDERASFLEAFLDDCTTGLVLSSYYLLKHHGYHIKQVRDERHRTRSVTSLASGKRCMKRWFGFPKDRSSLSQFSLLRTALDFLDFQSVSIILGASVAMMNSSSALTDGRLRQEAWMDQCRGGFTRILVDDLVLCADLKPLLFFDAFLSKIQMRPAHPHITHHATTRLIPKDQFRTRGVDSDNLHTRAAIWEEETFFKKGVLPSSSSTPNKDMEDENMANIARDMNVGFYLPLVSASDPRLLQAYVRATRALGSSAVEIYASAAVDIGTNHAWTTYAWKIHAYFMFGYIIMFASYTAVELSSAYKDSVDASSLEFSKESLAWFAILEMARELLTMVWSENIYHFFGIRPLLTVMFVVCVLGSSVASLLEELDGSGGQQHRDLRTFSVALAITAFWLKLVDFMRPLPILGAIIATIGSVTYSTRYLIVVIAITVMAFSFSFWILCAPALYLGTMNDFETNSVDDLTVHVSPFGNLLRSLEFTYNFGLGGFDTSDFKYCGVKEDGSTNSDIASFAVMLSIIYMIAVSVLALNVLIALMTNTYSRIADKGLAQTRFEQCIFMADFGFLVDNSLREFKDKQMQLQHQQQQQSGSSTAVGAGSASIKDVFNPQILFTLVSKAHKWAIESSNYKASLDPAGEEGKVGGRSSASAAIDYLTNSIDTSSSDLLTEQGAILDALEERLNKLEAKNNRNKARK